MSKKISFKKLLCLLYRISFSSMEYEQKNDIRFEHWNKTKNSLNYRLNRAVFLYLSGRSIFRKSVTEEELENQFVLDAISEIILKHINQRSKIYKNTKIRGLSHEKLFILASFFLTAYTGFVDILRCFRGLGARYKLNNPINLNSVCLAINFPSHGFSIPDRLPVINGESVEPFSSFGEFLSYYMNVHGDHQLLSLGEYTRRSKKVEAQTITPERIPAKTAKEFPRVIVKSSRSIQNFIVDASQLLGWMLLGDVKYFWQAESIIEAKRLYKSVSSIKYRKFIDNLASTGVKVESIFIIPFEDALGAIKYDPKVSKITYTFNYGDNLLIPPSKHILAVKALKEPFEIKGLLTEISLSAFRLTGGVVGFTDIFYLMNAARKVVKDKYGVALPNVVGERPKQRTAVLGYETDELNISKRDFINIAVFDVPPESRQDQLSRALVGDRTCDFEFIEEFFLDIADFAAKNNVRLLYKPKYSLTNYSPKYWSLIESIKEMLPDRFVVISPYTRMGSIIAAVESCLCMPYTSPRTIGEQLGKQSFYYVPERYRVEFEPGFAYSNSIIGKTGLQNSI